MTLIKKNTWDLILSDYQRYTQGGGKWSAIKEVIKENNHCFAYTFWMRLARQGGVIGKIASFKHFRMSKKYGIQIPWQTEIGEGFYIGHGVGIVINQKTKIGKHVTISQLLSIGSNHQTPATIEDNVYIGPGVCIVENVRIGHHAVIGAGTVVVKDVPAYATVVGNPGRVVNYKNKEKYGNYVE